mmetsp:Transcript_40350/g.77122  ORF Transcript_40350/g.77122 Transcript_40350/m.77122 type:complete len:116 (+) Transcript_40350:216-563(+)
MLHSHLPRRTCTAVWAIISRVSAHVSPARQFTQRATPGICEGCGRRYGCRCPTPKPTTREEMLLTRPEEPGPEDCCQSSPVCEHCVWTLHAEAMNDFHRRLQAFDAGERGSQLPL